MANSGENSSKEAQVDEMTGMIAEAVAAVDNLKRRDIKTAINNIARLVNASLFCLKAFSPTL